MSENITAKNEDETKDSLTVEQAIQIAKYWILATLKDENISNLGLEEIHHDVGRGTWSVTLGFSRPWNTVKNALTIVSGEVSVKRTMKVLTVSDKTHEVLQMSNCNKD